MNDARLCCVTMGREVFGIETAEVLEVLGRTTLRVVPRAPAFVAGVLGYRGEVLLAVSLPVLLGHPEKEATPSAVVMRDAETGERFALLVGAVADVVDVAAKDWEPNPATLDARRKSLFGGVYRVEQRTIVRLDAAKLQPSRLVTMVESERGVR